MFKKNIKGFTVIRVTIVAVIIVILAAFSIQYFVNFQLKAKTAEAKSEHMQMSEDYNDAYYPNGDYSAAIF
jgi:Tfp pilus assembly protein PilE